MRLQQEKIKKKLTNLWTGELAAVVAFWLCFFSIKVWLVDTKMVILILYPLVVLSFILLQGSVYWYILLKRMSKPLFLVEYAGNIYGILKMIDVILLCMGVPVILLNHSNIIVTALSIFIWLFSIIEWINYYVVRLSYSYNPMVLIGHLKNKTLKKSRIAREIDKRYRRKHNGTYK